MTIKTTFTTATHWGSAYVDVEDGEITAIRPMRTDPRPSPLLQAVPDSVMGRSRVLRPSIRKRFLESGPGSGSDSRGAEAFVEVSWDEALDLVAAELARTRREHGNEAIFAGSYGWASAGRFHHAQSQIHRFMKLFGGYTYSVDNYSYAAGLVLVPHIVGPLRSLLRQNTVWPVIRDHADLVILFGGLPLHNTDVANGGTGAHRIPQLLQACREAGVDFVNIGPVRDAVAENLEAEWIAPRPNTDTAIMLGMAHTLLVEELYDGEFLNRYCVGFEQFAAYLRGNRDGIAKSADWAAAIAAIDAGRIRDLARRAAAGRCMIGLTAGLQRADHGEQPVWMVITLAAMLGQIGLPGGGFGLFYGNDNVIGAPIYDHSWPSLPQGENPVDRFIPVARIADMLLHPGESFDYNGGRYRYPDIRMVYWAGGNPFHHHQDLNRLVRAFKRPRTIVVNDIWWTATARHADIVLPIASPLERNDICMSRHDHQFVAMQCAIEPRGEARSDFDVFSELSARLGFAENFSEGKTESDWLREFWKGARERAVEYGFELPDFDSFWKQGVFEIPLPPEDRVLLADFRADPEANPLPTPSGKIEIFSAAIDAFGYADCPGHPVWLEPCEWLGGEMASHYPLHLISGQPPDRLHGQNDGFGPSRKRKIAGREALSLNPADARRRGIRQGDVVRVYNDRGACLAGANLSDAIMPGVVQLFAGAWYDPERPGEPGSLDKHGNSNVLTRDRGTSSLSQATTAHTTLVEVERFVDPAPPVTAFEPPELSSREDPG